MSRLQERIAVFGLGYVGLPLALSFARRGCLVYGVDTNRDLVGELNSGITHLKESCRGVDIRDILASELEAGLFKAVSDPREAMEACNNIIITVGLPVAGEGRVYTGHLESCARAVAGGLKKGDLVVLRSTVVPGMTRELVKPALEENGLEAGVDFDLAYSSERIAEGRAFEEFENMPGVVSGITPASAERARALLSIVTRAEITVASSFEAVETAKVVENISRDVDIAMVNELARFTGAMGVDIFEVISLANTHKRVNLLTPGPGVGGFCIPCAVYYLKDRAERMGVDLPLMTAARNINDGMAGHVVSLVMRNLRVPPKKAVAAVLGFAMKDFSGDDRGSPALKIIDLLENCGVTVRAFDPAVATGYSFKAESQAEALAGANCVLPLARQHGIDFYNAAMFRELMSKEAEPFIVDTKNIYAGVSMEGIRIVRL